MPDRTTAQLKSKFANDQDEGAIEPSDIGDIVDTFRPSVGIESFQGVTEDTTDGIPFDRDTTWTFKDPDWPARAETDAPDWFWIRSKLIGSQASRFSRITALLRPTTDLAGWKYIAPADGLSRMFMVQWSLRGFTSHSMSGSVSFYRGQSWPSASVRQSAYPFDTGISPTAGKYPFVLKDTELVMMAPNDELRWRFEYFGASEQQALTYSFADGVLTPTLTSADDENPAHFIASLQQMSMTMVSLGPVDSFQDTYDTGGEVFPVSTGDHYGTLFSNANWRSSGVVDNGLIG